MLVVAAFIPVAIGMDLLLGGYRSSRSRAPDDARRACVVPRFAETREFRDVAVLGHRGRSSVTAT